MWNIASVHEFVDLLNAAAVLVAAGTLSLNQFSNLETAFGLRSNPDGLLAARNFEEPRRPGQVHDV